MLGGCALLLAGCGGKKKEAEVGSLYKRGPVISCLRAHDFTVSTQLKDVNFIAYSATGGGLRAWENGTHRQVDLIVAFGQSSADARQTLKGMKRFAQPAADLPLADPPRERGRLVRLQAVAEERAAPPALPQRLDRFGLDWPRWRSERFASRRAWPRCSRAA